MVAFLGRINIGTGFVFFQKPPENEMWSRPLRQLHGLAVDVMTARDQSR